MVRCAEFVRELLPRQGSTPARCVGEALASRPSIDRSYVTFLSCTDNDIDVAYLKELDKSAQNVDEVRMTILLLHQLGFSIPGCRTANA